MSQTIFDILTEEQLNEILNMVQKEVAKSVTAALKQIPINTNQDNKPVAQKKEAVSKNKKVVQKEKVPLEEEDLEDDESSNAKLVQRVEEKSKPVVITETDSDIILNKYYTEKAHVLTGKDTLKYKDYLKLSGLSYAKYGVLGSGWMFAAVNYDKVTKKLQDKGISFSEKDFVREEPVQTKVNSAIKVAQKNFADMNISEKPAQDKPSSKPPTPRKEEEKIPVKPTPTPKAKPASFAKNKPWGNFEDKETGIVFLKLKDGVNAVGYQDRDSKASALDSVLPLDDDLIKECIARGWKYNLTIVPPKEDEPGDEEVDVNSEDES